MAVTKSGIETPTDAPSKPLTVPVKVYPGSSNLGKNAGSVSIASPAKKSK